MLREQLWFDFCDDLPIEIEQRIDEGISEAERFKERAEQVKEMPRGAARTAAGAELLSSFVRLKTRRTKTSRPTFRASRRHLSVSRKRKPKRIATKSTARGSAAVRVACWVSR